MDFLFKVIICGLIGGIAWFIMKIMLLGFFIKAVIVLGLLAVVFLA